MWEKNVLILQTLQTFARMFTGTKKFDHISPVLKDLRCIPIKENLTRCRCGFQLYDGPSPDLSGLFAGVGKHCVFGHLGLVFIWSCFVFCLLLYVISAPVLAEAVDLSG